MKDVVFFVDSRIVYCWLQRYEASSFHTWVCNRLQSIFDVAHPSQFCWVAGIYNAADVLTKGYSAAFVAGGSALSVIVASWFSTRENRIGPRKMVEGCVETCMSSVPLAAAVAAAGMVIGCIELTGLSGKFTLLLFQLSGGYLIPSLVLSGVILILLGMGMPTTGVYIMGVALLAPVLTGKYGLPTMPVHMFLLFYACLSAITPPVAVANFAAAAIAGANPFRLGPYAVKLAVG